MKQSFAVSGMTCQGCSSSILKSLKTIEGAKNLSVDLEKGRINGDFQYEISAETVQSYLPDKYSVSVIDRHVDETQIHNDASQRKLAQLKPLFLILGYITIASVWLNIKDSNIQNGMLDFMGLFFIVFSFFKLLDVSGFASSFKMYDPLAKMLPAYGFIYPFIELVLGVLFLTRTCIIPALITTLVLLTITTIGVSRSLLSKQSIQCACLGTVLDLPMTEATFIENVIMIIMAVTMLFQMM